MLEKYNPRVELNCAFNDNMWNYKSELGPVFSDLSDDFSKIEFQEQFCRLTDSELQNKLILRKKSISCLLELNEKINFDFCIKTLQKLADIFELNNKDTQFLGFI